MATSTAKSSTRMPAGTNGASPLHVLLVDDEPGFLKAAKLCLELKGGFQVDTASSVEEATRKMKKKSYDAVVSDYMMPEKDGIEFLKEIREGGCTLPFILFTVKSPYEVATKAIDLGADKYLCKVGDPEIVYNELANSIRKAAGIRQTRGISKEQ